MKYYSESLEKLFDTEDALKEAESAAANKEKKKELRTEELTAARKAVQEAEKKYSVLLSKYCKDYGTYSYPASCGKLDVADLADILEQIAGFHIV